RQAAGRAVEETFRGGARRGGACRVERPRNRGHESVAEPPDWRPAIAAGKALDQHKYHEVHRHFPAHAVGPVGPGHSAHGIPRQARLLNRHPFWLFSPCFLPASPSEARTLLPSPILFVTALVSSVN